MMKKQSLLFILTAVATLALTACPTPDKKPQEKEPDVKALKPVIYFYPTHTMNVQVALKLNGYFTCTYPEYHNGWDITAKPDGTVIDNRTGKEYSYLYWEAQLNTNYDMSQGFVVKGSDTASFLQEKLSSMGLTPKEYNEFIVYWLPKMQQHAYNLITFQNTAYTDNAVLSISPQPDSLLRVFMAYRPLHKPISIPEQKLNSFKRHGFTVVEWGGTEIR